MPPPEKPPRRYGPVGLHRADLGQVGPRHLLEVVVGLVVAEQALGLDAVERTVGADQVGEVTQVEDVAEHAGDEEERRLGTALAGVHGDEVLEPRAGRHDRADGRSSAAGRRRPTPAAGVASAMSPAHRLDRGRLEQHGDREVDGEDLA